MTPTSPTPPTPPAGSEAAPLCRDCRWCHVPFVAKHHSFLGFSWSSFDMTKIDWSNAMCRRRRDPERNGFDPVTGEERVFEWPASRCAHERESNWTQHCGPSARFFEPRQHGSAA